jgi:L-asparaginase/Glu-tRNA(Gln) amidotransferase subunit D
MTLQSDELGFIASDELNPQESRILLSLALLNKEQPAPIQELFRTD